MLSPHLVPLPPNLHFPPSLFSFFHFMAETQPKRRREQGQDEHELFSGGVEITKRHKNSYNQILSILDDDTEDEHQETTQDLTDFFSALQEALSSSDPIPELTIDSDQTVKPEAGDGDGGKDKERVIRHLLEASDDELGIPDYRVSVGGGGDGEAPTGEHGGFPVSLCDELCEIEDDAANFCTLVHSELIM
ncbi:hypothetical protein L1987_16748 [Smallanthus sonchifolius]|uniref:Uncharacterized protein n=1 Tax=Smallanthus sonchifolius TaxID=185202 RepID=A0ACB9IW21_9ASTR|nr:hypothetical protein L1987_16748 [Smallanthus sonchifolius]